MEKYSVSYSKASEIQYFSHLDFLDNVSKNAVVRLIEAFEKADRALVTNPFAYPVFYKDFRRLTVSNRYIMMFKVIGNEVYVDKILDMRTEEYNGIVNEIEDVTDDKA